MAVLIETSLGDLTIDLNVDECPLACKNFLKLCKVKAFNNNIFFNVQRDFIAQTGDPTNTGKGGESAYQKAYGDQAKYFKDEIFPHIKHTKMGTVGMASKGEDLNCSQWYITLGDNQDQLDGKHTAFGEVSEGFETLNKINDVYCDTNEHFPIQDIRIHHTIVLDDPYDDPPGLEIPGASPARITEPSQVGRIGELEKWRPGEDDRSVAEIEEAIAKREAHSRAVVLEMIGDLQYAEQKPPENVIWACKLNPVTTSEDLELIFSQFGRVRRADVVTDWKTGDSLQYAFIEFEDQNAAETAYLKMDNVLIDDRRIHVDFCQSVAKDYFKFKRGGKFSEADRNGGKGKKNFELKTGSGGRGGGQSYDMVFDDGGSGKKAKKEKKEKKEKRGDDRRHDDGRDRRDRDRDRDRYEDRGRGDRRDHRGRDDRDSRRDDRDRRR